MAHDLFRDTMAYVGKTPWHGLGKQVPQATSARDFLTAAGLNWRINLLPARGAKMDKKGRWKRLTVTRDAVAPEVDPVDLGIVSPLYVPLQNIEAFAFFDPLIRNNWAHYEAAGALGDGETIWVQVRLRDDMEVQPGEVVERYLLLRNRHNGEGAVSIRFTPFRVVCQNTLSFSERHTKALANVRHSRSMKDRLDNVTAQAVMHEIEAFSRRAQRVFASMAKTFLKPTQQLELLDLLCGRRPEQPPPGPIPARRTLVERRLEDQKLTDAQAGEGTLWALYNAITWAEDERARIRSKKDAEAGLNAMWFGAGADHKAAAFDALASLTDAP